MGESNTPSAGRTVLAYADQSVNNRVPAERACANSLRCGLIAWATPIPAVVAIVLGIRGLDRVSRQAQPGRVRAWFGIGLGIAGILAWIWAGWAIVQMRSVNRQVFCLSNLREVGAALHQYANDNHGALPESWEDLLTSGALEMSGQVLFCQEGKVKPGSLTTLQAAVAACQDGRSSYLYLGRGLSIDTVHPETVLAAELGGPHRGHCNVLFADGHCESMRPEALVAYLQEQLTSGPKLRAKARSPYATTNPAGQGR